MIWNRTNRKWVRKPLQASARVELLPCLDLHRLLIEYRFSLYFYENFRADQFLNLDHASCRSDVLEDCTMGLSDVFPSAYVGNVNSRPNHIFELGTNRFQRSSNIIQGLNSLLPRISDTDHFPFRVCLGGGGVVHEIAYPDCPRITDDRLPFRPRRILYPIRHVHPRPTRLGPRL